MNDKKNITSWQFVLLILSIVLLFTFAIQTVFNVDADTSRILNLFDNAVCILFLIDFFVRLFNAPSKKDFMKWGWLDFLSSIPFLEYFRWARIARIIRFIRMLRNFRSLKILFQFMFRNKAKSALSAAVLITFLIIIFSSICILNVETDPNSNIKDSEDALWWAISTVTTVGYGDRFPVTLEGRIIASILMITGIGMFGTLSAVFASFFLEANKRETQKVHSENKDL